MREGGPNRYFAVEGPLTHWADALAWAGWLPPGIYDEAEVARALGAHADGLVREWLAAGAPTSQQVKPRKA